MLDHTDVVEMVEQGVSGTRPQVVLTSVLSAFPRLPFQLQPFVHAGVRFQRRVLIPTTMSVWTIRSIYDKHWHYGRKVNIANIKMTVWNVGSPVTSLKSRGTFLVCRRDGLFNTPVANTYNCNAPTSCNRDPHQADNFRIQIWSVANEIYWSVSDTDFAKINIWCCDS
jgi:hypothetical protein